MSPLTRTLRLLSLAWLGALATPLAASQAPAGPDSLKPAAAAPAAAEEEAPAIKISGYAGASYTYSTQPDGRMIVGRLYDRFHDSFVLNVFKLTVERPYDATKLSAGFRGDLLFGQNAEYLKSSGFNLGLDGDVEQLYVVLNIPTSNGNGVQFKFGKMVTLLGLEVIEEVANPNWSVGNQFNFVENLTSTGIEMGVRLSPALDIQLRVDNGWDRLVVPDGHKSFMGRIGLTGGSTTLGLIGYAGNQQPESAPSAMARRRCSTRSSARRRSGCRPTTARRRRTTTCLIRRRMPPGGRSGSGSPPTCRPALGSRCAPTT